MLLATGLATPVAAAGLSAVMITALRTAVWKDGVQVGGPGEDEVLLAVAAVALAEEGPGGLSLDAACGKERSGPMWSLGALGAGALGSQLAIAAGRRQHPREVEQPAATTPATSAPVDGAGVGAAT